MNSYNPTYLSVESVKASIKEIFDSCENQKDSTISFDSENEEIVDAIYGDQTI